MSKLTQARAGVASAKQGGKSKRARFTRFRRLDYLARDGNPRQGAGRGARVS